MRCSNRPPTCQRSWSVAASSARPAAALALAAFELSDDVDASVAFLQLATTNAMAVPATRGSRLSFMGLSVRRRLWLSVRLGWVASDDFGPLFLTVSPSVMSNQ